MQFGEELFDLLSEVVSCSVNREVLDTIRGEYGLLWCLYNQNRAMTVGELTECLQVVPGRVTDILKSLEKKGMITRQRSSEDKRVVWVSLLEAGKEETLRRRQYIHEKFSGIDQLFQEEEKTELLRLLKILLAFAREEQ